MKELPKSLTDKQEMFNAAYRGLAAQGWVQSITKYGACLYRGPNGLKCAIGHCIPDELFDQGFEGDNACGVLRRLHHSEPSDFFNFANRLQSEHDNDGFHCQTNEMRAKFEAFAERHNLTIPQD